MEGKPLDQLVAAIDVGAWNVKYTHRADSGSIDFRVFPAAAPMATERDLGVDRRTRRDTVVVPVGKLRYEVGPDARLAQGAHEIRNLDEAYVLSDEYLAMSRGAMRYMRLSIIDLLVVGLPVTLFRKMAGLLERKMTGHHDLGDGKSVEVHRTLAMAQPMGAFLSYCVPHERRKQMLKERNVIVDVGGRTFDWLVTHGLKPLDRRSDDVKRGMLDVVNAIGTSVGDALGVRLTDDDLVRIDEALRTKTQPKFFGRAFDLSEHLNVGEKVVRDAIAALKHAVQEGSAIDNILLAWISTDRNSPHTSNL